MKTKMGYAPNEASFPFGGLDLLHPTTQLPPGDSPNCVNATTFRGSLLKRLGYSTVGTAIGSGTESVLKLFNFQTYLGTNLLVAFTATRAFSWNGTSWSNITRQGTIATLPRVSGGNGWSMAAGTITTGSYVQQAVSNARGQWMASDVTNFYVAVTSGTFNATGAIHPDVTSGLGTLTISGSTTATASTATIPFNSTEDGFIDVCQGVDETLNRVMVMTNGIDPPVYWNGTTSTMQLLAVDLGSTSVAFCTAKTVAVQNSYLVFANIQSSADFEPRTAMWSDTGNFQEWLNGDSGTLPEMNFEGEILRLIPYSQNLVVFSRNTIGCLCYVDSTVIFGSQIYVSDVKIVGPKAICAASPFIIYAGQDNLYLWDGGRIVSPIGDKISNLWRSSQSSTYIARTELFYNPSKAQVFFTFYTGASTCKMLVAEMGLTSFTFADADKSAKTKWYEWTLTDRPIGFELFSDSRQYESVVLASVSGKVMSFNSTFTDAGTTFNLTWDTGDLTIPEIYQSQFARWLELEFEAIGTSVVTYYSTDQGSSWILIGTTNLSTSHLKNKVNFDVTARFVRFRFVSADTASQFELSWYRTWLRPGGAR